MTTPTEMKPLKLDTLYLICPCVDCMVEGEVKWCEDAIDCDVCGRPPLKFQKVEEGA